MNNPLGRVSLTKVVHIVSRLNVGGVAQQVLTIHEGMNGNGFECSLVTGKTGDEEGDMLNYVSPTGTIHHIPEMGRSVHFLSDFKAFWKLFRYLRTKQPDIVHTHAAKAGALGRIAGLLAGIPVRVHSFHGNVFRGYFSLMASSVAVWIERMLGWISTVVVLPCESQRLEIFETYRVVPKKKTRIVRYGIVVDLYKDLLDKKEARRVLEVGADSLIVGAVGRMAPIKNHALLIESFARLPEKMGDQPLELLIVGAGECKNEIKEQVRAANLTSRVHFRSWLKDLRWAYAAMDVFALTSRNEGMPIAVMEAMASGVSTISTAVGGVVDLVRDGETGILVNEHTGESFSRKLEVLLLDKQLREEISERARRYVQEMHSDVGLVQNTRNLYRELLN